jgi:hypothetical protein
MIKNFKTNLKNEMKNYFSFEKLLPKIVIGGMIFLTMSYLKKQKQKNVRLLALPTKNFQKNIALAPAEKGLSPVGDSYNIS